MNILMTGGTGFIGTALSRRLAAAGHTIVFYVRDRTRAAVRLGRDNRFVTDVDQIAAHEAIDAIVNLAGAPIAGSLWSTAYRRRLVDSRIGTTKALVDLARRLERPPKVIISASAAGYYGDGGERLLTEEEPAEDIFMSTLCQRWEHAAEEIRSLGVRLAIPRISVVLGTDGGAFPSLVRPLRFGLGAVIASGNQYFPWIHKTDLLRMIEYMLDNEDIDGPFNAAAPDARTQRDFNRAIADHLGRPMFLRAPAVALKVPLGELSDLFLKGQRMSVDRILGTGFRFDYPDLPAALDDLLG